MVGSLGVDGGRDGTPCSNPRRDDWVTVGTAAVTDGAPPLDRVLGPINHGRIDHDVARIGAWETLGHRLLGESRAASASGDRTRVASSAAEALRHAVQGARPYRCCRHIELRCHSWNGFGARLVAWSSVESLDHLSSRGVASSGSADVLLSRSRWTCTSSGIKQSSGQVGHRGCPSATTSQASCPSEPPPEDGRDWSGWADRNGGVDLGLSMLRLTIVAKSDATVVLDTPMVSQQVRNSASRCRCAQALPGRARREPTPL